MSKYFDIKPPTTTSSNHSGSTKRSSSKSNRQSQTKILYFVVFIVIAIFLFSFFNKTDQTYTEVTPTSTINSIDGLAQTAAPETSSEGVVTPSATPQPSSTDSPAVSATTSENINITVLNGARTSGMADSAKKTLESNNIPVSQIGDTANPYTETIVYYTDKNLDLAKKIKDTLATNNPTLVADTTLANDDKITIVIGAK